MSRPYIFIGMRKEYEMPVKEEILGKGQLFVIDNESGEAKPIGQVCNCDINTTYEVTDTETIQTLSNEFESTFHLHLINRNSVLLLLWSIGEKVENNWLKMHGLPMRRKISGKRKEKRTVTWI